MRNARDTMRKKRGVWIGVYVLIEVFAFMVYFMIGALVAVYENSGLWTAGQPWKGILVLMILVVAAAEIGYALIYRITVLYRGIRHRTFWIAFNIVCFSVRAGMILMMTGVIPDDVITMLPSSVISGLRYFLDSSVIGICYAVLVARDIGSWLGESKNIG